MGDAVFMFSLESQRIFFLCPACGCAWERPPTPLIVDTADPPNVFARQFCIASLDQIELSGLNHFITREVPEWVYAFEKLPGFTLIEHNDN